MASEAVRTENIAPSERVPFFTRLRDRFRTRPTVTEQAVAEAVREHPDLTGEYPRPVSDAVITGLDRGLQVRPGTTLEGHRAVGFGCDERPTMILVGDPVDANLAVYRLEVHQPGGRFREMELVVGGRGDERELLKATAWIEAHPPGEHMTVVTEPEHRMDPVELLKLAGDLDGRVRDETFLDVHRTDGPRR